MCEEGRGGGRKKNQTQAFITSCSGWRGKQKTTEEGGGRMHTLTNTYIFTVILYVFTRISTHTHTHAEIRFEMNAEHTDWLDRQQVT